MADKDKNIATKTTDEAQKKAAQEAKRERIMDLIMKRGLGEVRQWISYMPDLKEREAATKELNACAGALAQACFSSPE